MTGDGELGRGYGRNRGGGPSVDDWRAGIECARWRKRRVLEERYLRGIGIGVTVLGWWRSL